MATFNAAERAVVVTKDKEGRDRIYSEPAPDVAVQQITSVVANLKAGDIDAKMKVDMTEKLVELGKRSTTIMFLREALYRLSEMCNNGALVRGATAGDLSSEIDSVDSVFRAFPSPMAVTASTPNDESPRLRDSIDREVAERVADELSKHRQQVFVAYSNWRVQMYDAWQDLKKKLGKNDVASTYSLILDASKQLGLVAESEATTARIQELAKAMETGQLTPDQKTAVLQSALAFTSEAAVQQRIDREVASKLNELKATQAEAKLAAASEQLAAITQKYDQLLSDTKSRDESVSQATKAINEQASLIRDGIKDGEAKAISEAITNALGGIKRK